MTTIISGIIGLLMMPWKQQGGDFLVVIQSNFSTLLGPIIGIMLADYFLVRKCTLNVDDLYNVGGQYQYTRGFNMHQFHRAHPYLHRGARQECGKDRTSHHQICTNR